MNMKMNVSTTIFIPSELASAVFPLGFELVYLRWVLPQKESAFLYPIYTPFPICSCTEDTAGAFNTPQIGSFTSISLT